MNDSNAQMHKTIRNVLSLRGGNSESSPECFLRCVSAMVAASIGAKAAVLIVLTVALVALVGSLTVNAIAGPSALEQRFTPRQLGLRTALMRKQRATQLWAVQDNGVSTTINTRGFANGDGGISYGSNFVYGSTGTPVVQANDVSDQWWRYGNEGNYFMTGSVSLNSCRAGP